MDPLDEDAVKSILSAGNRMGRERYQEGRIVLVGKRVKKWRGHFYVYEKQADGSEIRRFRNVQLGLKAQMDKAEARAKLRDMIGRETSNVAQAPVAVTFRWFYENRFLPQKEQQWKVTSRPKTKRFIENYVLKRFGNVMLAELDKFTLQTYLNELAPNFSKSVLTKVRVYLSSILGEAVELEFIIKNPAARLAVPRSGKRVVGLHLTPEQIPIVLFNLSNRDRLIVRMFLVLGLRPGELFALRWNDKGQNSLRVDSSITDGIEVETKTEGSNTNVWLPISIDTEFEWWRSACKDPSPDAFIFPSARATAINTNNFLFRILKEAGKKAACPASRTKCSDALARRTWRNSRRSRMSRRTFVIRVPRPH
jgi:integrase